MSARISIYEEPGVLLAVRAVDSETPVAEQAAALLKGGIEQGRKVLAAVEDPSHPESNAIYPQLEPSTATFPELTEQIQQMLGEHKIFDSIFVMDSALRGEHADDPEVWMLAASVYELVRMYTLAAPLLEKALPVFDGLRKSAVEIRLARAWGRSGRREGVADLVRASQSCEELPQAMRIEGLLLIAMTQEKEEALETLDELLDAAEEHLGDHRIAAEALELHADLLSDDDPKKAQQFYLAAGKMLLRLQDPYFFGLNERLVVHHLRQGEMEIALQLSQEMFTLLKQSQAPSVAHVPFLVFAAWVHEKQGDAERASYALKGAQEIDPEETLRVQANLQQALAAPVRS